ncbi:MAG: hypothetical protein ABJE66_17460 [Deltaproteobacteria bacterium]
MRIWVPALGFVIATASACTTSGSLDLQLSLPDNPDLAPTGMTSVTVVASSPDFGTVSRPSLLTGRTFSADTLPIAKNVQIDVLFHDDSNRLVGVGEAANPIDIVGDKDTKVSISMRRPFIYASSGTKLYSFDPTLDPRSTKFQGQLTGVTAPQVAISVGGDRLVVASTNQLQVIDTATNMVTGSPIAIPGMIKDAAPIPNSHRIAVAHSAGISIVDIDSGTVTTGGSASVDKVTVGPTLDARMAAYGLVGRIAAPAGPLDPCTGTSMLLTIDVDSPDPTAVPVATGQAVSAIAASPDQPMLFAALPCTGTVSKVDNLKFTDVATLPRAAVVAVANERVWAAGTKPSTPHCVDSSNKTVTCTAAAVASCTASSAIGIDYVTTGANLIVLSIPVDGSSAPTEVDVPEPRETIVSLDDMARQHAQVLRTLGMQPLDLVTLPGGQYVSLITKNTFFISALVETPGNTVILPCLAPVTSDWLLMDMASSSIANRVRTQCVANVGPTPPGTIFPLWDCDPAPVGQAPMLDMYQPISVGALFGAR